MGELPTRNFISQWTYDRSQDRDDLHDESTLQWRSVDRVAAHKRRRQDLQSDRNGDKSEQETREVYAEDLAFVRGSQWQNSAGSAPSSPEQTKPPRVRPQSASLYRRPVDRELMTASTQAKDTRLRPQSAKTRRPEMADIVLAAQMHAQRAAKIPSHVKTSKWAEMLARGPGFQQSSLRQLEMETYKLLHSALQKRQQTDKTLRPRRRRRRENVTKDTKGPQEAHGVACGSGLKLARSRKQRQQEHDRRMMLGLDRNSARVREVDQSTASRTHKTLLRGEERRLIQEKTRQRSKLLGRAAKQQQEAERTPRCDTHRTPQAQQRPLSARRAVQASLSNFTSSSRALDNGAVISDNSREKALQDMLSEHNAEIQSNAHDTNQCTTRTTPARQHTKRTLLLHPPAEDIGRRMPWETERRFSGSSIAARMSISYSQGQQGLRTVQPEVIKPKTTSTLHLFRRRRSETGGGGHIEQPARPEYDTKERRPLDLKNESLNTSSDFTPTLVVPQRSELGECSPNAGPLIKRLSALSDEPGRDKELHQVDERLGQYTDRDKARVLNDWPSSEPKVVERSNCEEKERDLRAFESTEVDTCSEWLLVIKERGVDSTGDKLHGDGGARSEQHETPSQQREDHGKSDADEQKGTDRIVDEGDIADDDCDCELESRRLEHVDADQIAGCERSGGVDDEGREVSRLCDRTQSAETEEARSLCLTQELDWDDLRPEILAPELPPERLEAIGPGGTDDVFNSEAPAEPHGDAQPIVRAKHDDFAFSNISLEAVGTSSFASLHESLVARDDILGIEHADVGDFTRTYSESCKANVNAQIPTETVVDTQSLASSCGEESTECTDVIRTPRSASTKTEHADHNDENGPASSDLLVSVEKDDKKEANDENLDNGETYTWDGECEDLADEVLVGKDEVDAEEGSDKDSPSSILAECNVEEQSPARKSDEYAVIGDAAAPNNVRIVVDSLVLKTEKVKYESTSISTKMDTGQTTTDNASLPSDEDWHAPARPIEMVPDNECTPNASLLCIQLKNELDEDLSVDATVSSTSRSNGKQDYSDTNTHDLLQEPESSSAMVLDTQQESVPKATELQIESGNIASVEGEEVSSLSEVKAFACGEVDGDSVGLVSNLQRSDHLDEEEGDGMKTPGRESTQRIPTVQMPELTEGDTTFEEVCAMLETLCSTKEPTTSETGVKYTTENATSQALAPPEELCQRDESSRHETNIRSQTIKVPKTQGESGTNQSLAEGTLGEAVTPLCSMYTSAVPEKLEGASSRQMDGEILGIETPRSDPETLGATPLGVEAEGREHPRGDESEDPMATHSGLGTPYGVNVVLRVNSLHQSEDTIATNGWIHATTLSSPGRVESVPVEAQKEDSKAYYPPPESAQCSVFRADSKDGTEDAKPTTIDTDDRSNALVSLLSDYCPNQTQDRDKLQSEPSTTIAQELTELALEDDMNDHSNTDRQLDAVSPMELTETSDAGMTTVEKPSERDVYQERPRIEHGLELRCEAACRIQAQYRRYVWRGLLLDQLHFLLSKHRRQTRKKTRLRAKKSVVGATAGLAALNGENSSSGLSAVIEGAGEAVSIATSPPPACEPEVASSNEQTGAREESETRPECESKAETSDSLAIYAPELIRADNTTESTAVDSPQSDQAAESVSMNFSIPSDAVKMETDRKSPDNIALEKARMRSLTATTSVKQITPDSPQPDGGFSFSLPSLADLDAFGDNEHELIQTSTAFILDDAVSPEPTDIPAILVPEEAKSQSWERCVDSTTDNTFYFLGRNAPQWTPPSAVSCVTTTAECEPKEAEQGAQDAGAVHAATGSEREDAQTLPSEHERVGPWQTFLDDASGQLFYYNVETGESSWDPPDSQVAAEKIAFEAVEESSGSALAADPAATACAWVMYVDPATQMPYFVNVETLETRWERPAELATDATAATDWAPAAGGTATAFPPAAAQEDSAEEDEYVISLVV